MTNAINASDYRAKDRHKTVELPQITRVEYMRKLNEEAKRNSFIHQIMRAIQKETKSLGRDAQNIGNRKIGKQTVKERAQGFAKSARMTTLSLAKTLGLDKAMRRFKPQSKRVLAQTKRAVKPVAKNLELDARATGLDKAVANAPGEAQKVNKGFAYGFAKFLQNPGKSVMQATSHVQHAFKLAAHSVAVLPKTLQQGPDKFHKALDKIDEAKINMAMNSMTRSKTRLNARRENNMELGKVNKQGLSLEEAPQGGFYFVAHKDTKIPTGQTNGRGQVYMHMKKGQHTATIVPQGRKSMQALARYSHGDRNITMNADSNSRIILGKNLKNPDILNAKTAGNLTLRNSVLNLDKNADLGKNVILQNSQVKANDKLQDLHMNNSHADFQGSVKDSSFDNCYNIQNSGTMNGVTGRASSIVNRTNMKDALIERSSVETNAKNDFQQATVRDAQLNGTTVVGDYTSKDPNKRTIIQHGHYEDSQVRASNLDIGTNSYVRGSSIAGSYAKNQSPLTSRIMMNGSNVQSSTLSAKNGQQQQYSGADLQHVLAVGNQKVVNSSINASKDNPTFLRNADLNSVLSSTRSTPVAFAEVRLDGKGKQISDNNIPKMLQLVKHGAAYNLMRRITGYVTNGKPLSTINTKRGKMVPADQINTVSSNLASPVEGAIMRMLHIKDFTPQRDRAGLSIRHIARSRAPHQEAKRAPQYTTQHEPEPVGPDL